MLNRDFKEFVGLLNARSVDYLVLGGYALAAHGHPRYPGDIDFWVRPSAQNIERLLDVLQDCFGSLGLVAAISAATPWFSLVSHCAASTCSRPSTGSSSTNVSHAASRSNLPM